ncbi:hypothetical protein [Floccifex sp.]|uniref:hypothetical protein n=1 Tax=Floccifex sp. TaxID=2815810 RepID=UPI002A752D44|nr:hypothetical protein [Floccifex sp.]MDY2958268.1 hypothetical protein [Floccifex sp.]
MNRFRYYSKNKKLWARLLILFTASLGIILFSLYMQVLIFENKKEQNERLYGSWQAVVFNVDDNDLQTILNHQMLENKVEMNIVENAYYQDEYVGTIGYVEDDFFDLNHLTLKKGHYPEKENEIMLEAYKLDEMGLDYTLGQPILLSDDYGNTEEYVLCGILDNYSINWLGNQNLVKGFIYDDSSNVVISKHIFFDTKKGYDTVLDEMNLDGKIVRNTNVEFTYDPLAKQNFPFTLLSGFSVCYAVLLLLYMLYHWTNQHTKEIQILKSLGADTGMLYKDLLSLLMKTMVLPILIFILISLFLSVPVLILLCSIGIYILSIIFASIIVMMQIQSIPMNMNTFSNQEHTVKKQ